MDNPLDLLAPINPMDRIYAFAKDLAYGAINNMWSSRIKIIPPYHYEPIIINALQTKWEFNFPPFYNLLSLGFLQRDDLLPDQVPSVINDPMFAYPISSDSFVILTPKAFALLEKPITPPSVFISYKQTESSALALLIESRLKNVDPNISIFIDKNIESGTSINSRISEVFELSKFFICLLSSKTLSDSQPVRDEINLAKSKPDCTIIPICHNGYTPDDLYTQYFGDNKAIIIKHPESAEEYEINMTRLLIRLGYPTT